MKQASSAIQTQKHPCYNSKTGRFEHDWDYCVTFRICTKCGKVEDLPSRVITNYEISGEDLVWYHPEQWKYMMTETGNLRDVS